MTGVAWVALGLFVIAATPAGIVWVVMRGKLNAAHRLFAYASGSWRAEKRDLYDSLESFAAENASLRGRNEMLSGLVGADGERSALNGSCADEAGWAR